MRENLFLLDQNFSFLSCIWYQYLILITKDKRKELCISIKLINTQVSFFKEKYVLFIFTEIENKGELWHRNFFCFSAEIYFLWIHSQIKIKNFLDFFLKKFFNFLIKTILRYIIYQRQINLGNKINWGQTLAKVFNSFVWKTGFWIWDFENPAHFPDESGAQIKNWEGGKSCSAQPNPAQPH